MSRSTSKKDDGFTLIELLVVIGIIGILATVAVSQYSLYKQKAVDGEMHSTLRSGKNAMESYYVEHETYAAATETTLHDNFGFRKGPVTTFNIVDGQQSTYFIRVCTPGGTTPGMEFDSTVGQATPTGTCP